MSETASLTLKQVDVFTGRPFLGFLIPLFFHPLVVSPQLSIKAISMWGKSNFFQVSGPWGVPLGRKMPVVVLNVMGWPPM